MDPRAIRRCPVETALDSRVSEPVFVLTAAEHPLDFAIDPGAAGAAGGGSDDEDGDDATVGSLASKASGAAGPGSRRRPAPGATPCGHRRRWHWRHGPSGMRHTLTYCLLFPDAHVPRCPPLNSLWLLDPALSRCCR